MFLGLVRRVVRSMLTLSPTGVAVMMPAEGDDGQTKGERSLVGRVLVLKRLLHLGLVRRVVRSMLTLSPTGVAVMMPAEEDDG